jgi:structural maintenance of chromosome 2
MRPQEILGMVEEAAGTRMFEDRKDKAKRTMGKKEKRVAEITSLLHEEIMPKLEKLRAEKKSFIQYQKTVSELERLTRVVIASEWLSKRQQVEEREEDIKEKEQEQEDVKKGRKRSSKELEAAEKDFAAVTKKRNDEMSKGGKLKKLQDEVDRLGKDLVLVKTQAEIKEESIKKEEENVQTLVDELQEVLNAFL